MNTDLLNRLKKLLVMSERGTPNEAEIALSKAKEIAAEYDIDLATVTVAEGKVPTFEGVE